MPHNPAFLRAASAVNRHNVPGDHVRAGTERRIRSPSRARLGATGAPTRRAPWSADKKRSGATILAESFCSPSCRRAREMLRALFAGSIKQRIKKWLAPFAKDTRSFLSRPPGPRGNGPCVPAEEAA
jgi:hypothetical protein